MTTSDWDISDDRDAELERKSFVRRVLDTDFPIYGLAGSWEGLRVIEFSQSPHAIRTIVLHHRDATGATLTVSTSATFAEPHDRDALLHDLADDVLDRDDDANPFERGDDEDDPRAEIELVRSLRGRRWGSVTFLVDGTPIPFELLEEDDCWVALAKATPNQVAIAVQGRGTPLPNLGLVGIDDLGPYFAGSKVQHDEDRAQHAQWMDEWASSDDGRRELAEVQEMRVLATDYINALAAQDAERVWSMLTRRAQDALSGVPVLEAFLATGKTRDWQLPNDIDVIAWEPGEHYELFLIVRIGGQRFSHQEVIHVIREDDDWKIDRNPADPTDSPDADAADGEPDAAAVLGAAPHALYGVADWDDEVSVAGWDGPTIDLMHGDLEAPHVIVGSRDLEADVEPLTLVLMELRVDLSYLTQPDDDEGDATADDDDEDDYEVEGTLPGPDAFRDWDWETIAIPVDGTPVDFWVLEHGDAWVAYREHDRTGISLRVNEIAVGDLALERIDDTTRYAEGTRKRMGD